MAVVLAILWVSVARPGPVGLPYFWDEADVYVPGSVWVAEHNLNVTPGVFPDDYSRGHPPLLFLLAGFAFAVAGPAPPVGHLVILPFTVLALVCTYLLGALLFGRLAGGAAAGLLGATPLFLSIGNMLLPELPLTGLTIACVFLFARGHLKAAACVGAALVLIKETGVFTAGAVFFGILWQAWRSQKLWDRSYWTKLALAAAPLFVLMAFFVWQRATAGYFVFPHHQNLLWERPLSLADLGTLWPSLLFWHGRWIAVGTAVVCTVIWALAKKDQEQSADDSLGQEQAMWLPSREGIVAALCFLVLANALFFTKMFWLERYALPAHPGVCILVCGTLMTLSKGRGRWVCMAACAISILFGIGSLRARTRPNEEELTFAYADVIATHQQTYRVLFEAAPEDPTVVTAWPMTIELRHPYLGYVSSGAHTVHIDYALEERFDAAVVPQRSRHADALREEAQNQGLRLIGVFQQGTAAPLELYVR